MSIDKTNLIWVDLEMTGLDPDVDQILEIAMVITDSNLSIIAEFPSMVIHASEEKLRKMDEWNTSHHTKSGLWEKALKSNFTAEQVSKEACEFIKKYVPKKTSPMCGNSVWQDRRFLSKYMPEFEDFFHYRNLDVTALKILAQRWAPKVAKLVKKKSAHRALDDVKESVYELQIYKDNFLSIK